MNNIIKGQYAIRIFAFAALLLIGSSCEKLISVSMPVDKMEKDLVFDNEVNAEASVNGIYSRQIARMNTSVNRYLLAGGLTIWGGLSADELHYNSTSQVYKDIEANNIAITSSNLNLALWNAGYQDIYHINACIEGLEASTFTKAVRQRLMGECYFMRAFTYFYLVNLFGDVPLVTKTEYTINASMARTVATSIYNQIKADLLLAKDLLPESFIQGKKARANRYAAYAMLARTELYNQQWPEAQRWADSVLLSKKFRLETTQNVFLPSSMEAIWHLTNPNSQRTPDGTDFSYATPIYYMTEELCDVFDRTGDLRWKNWVKEISAGGKTYYSPFKYKVQVASGASYSEPYTMLRTAELFLIKAEAALQLGDYAASRNSLDSIRNRAGLPLLNTFSPLPDTPDALWSILETENQREYFCEWGHRWLDLKRWKGRHGKATRAIEVLSTVKTNWSDHAVFFPIPDSEILLNPFLNQNIGYEK